jgi:hypothetical protein
MIFVLTPVLIKMWSAQAQRGTEMSTIGKLSLGFFLVALSYLIMVGAAATSGPGSKASPLWLLAYVMILTLGELHVAPVGLALVSRATPARVLSLMMGLWLAASFPGEILGGWLGGFWSSMEKPNFFLMIAAVAGAGGVAMLVLKPMLRSVFDERPLRPRRSAGAATLRGGLRAPSRGARRAITSGIAASWFGAITCAPATPGTVASCSMKSTQICLPSARHRRILEPLHHVVGNDRAIEVLLDPARRAPGLERHHADQQRDPVGQSVLRKPRHIAAHHIDIHAELRLRELRARRDLSLEALRLPIFRRVDRHVGRTDEELGFAGHLAARGQLTAVADADRGLDQSAGVEIEHRLRIGLVAGGRVIAAQHQQVANADAARRADRFAGEAIAVAAGELQHRLDVVREQDGRGGLRAEMRAAPAPSVTFTASASPFSGKPFASTSSRLHETGGVISAVITNRPDAIAR